MPVCVCGAYECSFCVCVRLLNECFFCVSESAFASACLDMCIACECVCLHCVQVWPGRPCGPGLERPAGRSRSATAWGTPAGRARTTRHSWTRSVFFLPVFPVNDFILTIFNFSYITS